LINLCSLDCNFWTTKC